MILKCTLIFNFFEFDSCLLICSDSDDNGSIGYLLEPTIEPAVQDVASTSATPQVLLDSVNSPIESPFLKELEATSVSPSIDQESVTSSNTPADGKSLTTSVNPSTASSYHEPVTSHLSLGTIEVENSFSSVQKHLINYIDL